MSSLITPDNDFGGNCEPTATPPNGWAITPTDPPEGMPAPQWNPATETWEAGPPPPPYTPPLSLADLMP